MKKNKTKAKTELKCPNCGSNLESFSSNCPYCKAEIRNKKSSDALKEFSNGMQEILSYKKERTKSVLEKVVGVDLNSENRKYEEKREKDEELANYIKNFPIPNTKEDLTEFMILATSNVKKNTQDFSRTSDAWKIKMNQIMEKAKLTIKDENDLKVITDMYENCNKERVLNSFNFIYWFLSIFPLLFSFLTIEYGVCLFLGTLFSVIIVMFLVNFLVNYIVSKKKCVKFGANVEIKDEYLLAIFLPLVGVCMFTFLIHFAILDNNKRTIENYYSEETEKYDVILDIDFEENLIFSRYDVNVSVYDQVETLSHGQDEVVHFSLSNGTHKITFTSEDGDVSDSVNIDVEGNTKVKIHIACYSTSINIDKKSVEHNLPNTADEEENVDSDKEKNSDQEQTELEETNDLSKDSDDYFIMIVPVEEYIGTYYKDLEDELKEYGCTNIKIEKKDTTDENNYNESIADFTIDGKHYESFSKFKKDVEIKIVYWNNPDSNASKPKENNEILYPEKGSRLEKDFDGINSINNSRMYLNVNNISNKPSIKKYENAIVTDSVYEYIEYLKNNGFNVDITKYNSTTPYSGFTIYETKFKVSNSKVSWTMSLTIQEEDYVEYEFYINME